MVQDSDALPSRYAADVNDPKKKEKHLDDGLGLRNILIGSGVLVSIISVLLAFWAFNKSTAAQRASTAMQKELKDLDIENQRELMQLNWKYQRELKAMDLRQFFQKRYDDLAYDARFKVRNRAQATIYYRRFWHLQLEEYQYWCDDMIEQRIYEAWIDSRKLEWKRNASVGGVNYRAGWTDVEGFFRDHDHSGRRNYEEFVAFMNGVLHDTVTKISRDRCRSKQGQS